MEKQYEEKGWPKVSFWPPPKRLSAKDCPLSTPVDYCLRPLLGALRASGSVPAGLVRDFDAAPLRYVRIDKMQGIEGEGDRSLLS